MNKARRIIIKGNVEKMMKASNLLRMALKTESMALHNIETLGGGEERRELMSSIVASLTEANESLDAAIESMGNLIEIEF